MDVKSLAKSKRAHSQHHTKKHHPNQKSKAPSTGSVGATSANKPPGKQIKEKAPQLQGSSALSSNWDRYEEESDVSLSQPTDIILPKSKGADYAYLISEATAHSQTTSSSESFPSFDDVFTDFNQGVGSLVSVRGQSILSWTRDDNFLVDDQATSNLEASFLSLDLNAIAKQLAKVDLSQRLFIEEDLLPQELCSCFGCPLEDMVRFAVSSPSGLLCIMFSQNFLEVFALYYILLNIKKMGNLQKVLLRSEQESTTTAALDQDIEIKITSSDTAAATTNTTTTIAHQVLDFDYEELKSMNKFKDEPMLTGRTGQSYLNTHSIANLDKSSKFEAVAAEAELDMLLDSFNKTNFLDSSGSASSTFQQEALFNETVPTLFKGRDLSKPASSNLDDTIDDLLNETSSLINQSDASWTHAGNARPVIKGPDLSEPEVAPNLDDTIDDLCEEMGSSSLITRNNALKSQEVNAPAAPVSKSKLLDDFDSWLDTI